MIFSFTKLKGRERVSAPVFFFWLHFCIYLNHAYYCWELSWLTTQPYFLIGFVAVTESLWVYCLCSVLYCLLLYPGAWNAAIENPVSDEAGRFKAIWLDLLFSYERIPNNKLHSKGLWMKPSNSDLWTGQRSYSSALLVPLWTYMPHAVAPLQRSLCHLQSFSCWWLRDSWRNKRWIAIFLASLSTLDVLEDMV